MGPPGAGGIEIASRGAVEGVEDAAAAYRSLAPAVLGYLRASGADDPEDLLGEVFLQVAKDWRKFRGDDADRRRWVFTIARNRVVDAGRKRRRRPVIVAVTPKDPVAAVAEPPFDSTLAAALSELTAEQREVLLLRFVADLSLDQVAGLTGRTTSAVKAMQRRALARLGDLVPPELAG